MSAEEDFAQEYRRASGIGQSPMTDHRRRGSDDCKSLFHRYSSSHEPVDKSRFKIDVFVIKGKRQAMEGAR